MPKRMSGERTGLDAVFAALADPTRRAVVERLGIGPGATSDLARPFPMALPSFLQHLDVLEGAGLVTSHKTGRIRTYQLGRSSLQEATTWLVAQQHHWDRRLDQLDRVLAHPQGD